MSFVERTNNKISAVNNRAVDVATKAISEISPVQQRKTYNAFVVQGFPGIVYSRLHGGRECTCSAAHKSVNTILEEDGVAKQGVINEMLTGGTFGVENYGSDRWDDVSTEDRPMHFTVTDPQNYTSPNNLNPYQGNPDIENDGDLPVGDLQTEIDELVDMFDPAISGLGDFACPVCFGTGWVGGYSIMYGQRKVWGVHQVGMAGDFPGEIIAVEKPWEAEANNIQIVTALPKGAIGVTACNLYYKDEILKYRMKVNGKRITSEYDLLTSCSGVPVLIELELERQRFTHFELQFQTTDQSAYIEFPRITKSSDMQFLELEDPFQLLLSPNVPSINPEDIITDAVYGKVYMVQGVSPHRTRVGNSLGWELQVRVIQPYEVHHILPILDRVDTKNRTVNMSKSNITGKRII